MTMLESLTKEQRDFVRKVAHEISGELARGFATAFYCGRFKTMDDVRELVALAAKEREEA